MKVSELVQGYPIACDLGDVEVRGVTHDSRLVEAGDLFAALPGEHVDGRQFAHDAASRGAVAVLGRGPKPSGLVAAWLAAEDPRRWLGPLAARLYGHPDRELRTIGVTGTNGKTTVSALAAAMLEAGGARCARLGSLGHHFGGEHWASERTTPEASDLFKLLRRLRDRGASAAVMEVSSHALDLHRVGGLRLDVAVFTNLSRDHLDFHGDMESYFAAKRRLFEQLESGGRAVVNLDDEFGRKLAAELSAPVTFGAGGDVEIVACELDERGISATLATPRGELEISAQLRGRFNVDNVAAAVAVGEALTLPHEAVVDGVALTAPLTGRLEPVEMGQPFPVFIDFAHTEGALAAVLAGLAEMTNRRLIVVFGCGGDRDRGKREPMGRVAAELADLTIITSDNPRGEDPETIITAIGRGLKSAGGCEYAVIPDRREAIREAIRAADETCAVLIAGKGHETVQVVGDRVVPFSDRQEAEAALEERFGSRDVG
jgi:UDP-N-acetylmuramoyl-L-alanyl-D-glutamate--2,6-diaminopimelate ligase